MSNLKCPFCQQELNQDNPQSIECRNDDCKESYFMYGSKELWQELIRTKELLEIESSEHELCHDAMVKRTEEVNRIRKALDVALDWLGQVATPAKCDDELCREFTKRKLTEIKTALEQKDVK